MENNLENKARFFAQYWGQRVVRHLGLGLEEHTFLVNENILCKYDITEYYIRLKPLSSITNDDAIEVASLILKRKVKPLEIVRWDWRISVITNREKSDQYEDCEIEMFVAFHVDDNEIKFTWDYNHKKGTAVSERHCPNSIYAYDYLRSKGYALPWMGLSVEKLIEYGWIKLKTD